MGTYSRPGLTQGESALIDKSGSKINKELLDFGVNFETAKANIRLNEEAALTQQMQVYRQAEEIDDPDLKKRIWQDEWKMHWPGGPEDPEFIILKLLPERTKGWYKEGAFEFKLK